MQGNCPVLQVLAYTPHCLLATVEKGEGKEYIGRVFSLNMYAFLYPHTAASPSSASLRCLRALLLISAGGGPANAYM